MGIKRHDILEALGESETSWLPIALAGFGVGALVGAAVAILLAPKSGRELRHDLAERGRDLIGRGKQFVQEEKPNPPQY
jgi:hypothetical protein